jgi:hypothetical protein
MESFFLKNVGFRLISVDEHELVDPVEGAKTIRESHLFSVATTVW